MLIKNKVYSIIRTIIISIIIFYSFILYFFGCVIGFFVFFYKFHYIIFSNTIKETSGTLLNKLNNLLEIKENENPVI